uniref:eIF-4F 25 kDa subunit n=1 Tax=Ascaris lumbricoides TaxID=6252 RepID=A0A0M3II20_ASCLU
MTGEESTRSANVEETSDAVQEEAIPTPQIVIATGSSILSEHPLKQRWTYWYLNDQRDRSWEKRLKKFLVVFCINALSRFYFYRLYLNIRPPSMLHNTCDYNVFKENIQPMWEVPENANGGRWLITIDKSRHHDLLDAVWLEVLLAVIGDQFGKYTDDICGIVVNIRNKGSKISIWTTNASNDESNLKIGEILKQKLINPEIDQKIPRPLFDMLRYEDHQEVQYKSSSSVRAKFTISSQE